jgi:hypothetical protein
MIGGALRAPAARDRLKGTGIKSSTTICCTCEESFGVLHRRLASQRGHPGKIRTSLALVNQLNHHRIQPQYPTKNASTNKPKALRYLCQEIINRTIN